MSQAGIVDFEGSHPQVPTTFVCNVSSAIPIANTLDVLGSAVAAHSVPLQTVGSGNTVSINVQYAAAAGGSVANNAGVASFNSTDFTVDANGFVTLSGSAAAGSFTVDAATAPGTNPVVPNGSGVVTITGGQVAAGTTSNVIRTNSLAANTYTIQIQRSQAVGVSTVGDNGVSHFNSTFFTVDSNGFVSINGSAIGETITGNSGGALSPTAGNWNIVGAGSITTAGAASTLTIELTGLTNHAIQVGGTGATLTQVGPSSVSGQILQSQGAAADPAFSTATYPSTTTINQILYSSAANTVSGLATANNGVLITGTTGIPSLLANGTTGQVLTATTGSPPSWASPASSGTVTSVSVVSAHGFAGTVANPTTTPAITISTTQTGLLSGDGTSITGTPITQYNVLTAGATNLPNSVAPTSTSGVPLISQGSSSQPIFGTAVVAGGGTGAVTLTSHGVLLGNGTSAVTATAVGTNGQVLIGATGAAPAFATLTSTAGSITYTTGANSLNLDVTGYATGSWTPTLTGLTTAGTTTYVNQIGNYTVFGNIVVCSCLLQTSASTGTGTAAIGGFPFNFNNYASAATQWGGAGWTWPVGTTSLNLEGQNGLSYCKAKCSGSAVAAADMQMANASLTVAFTIAYLK